MNERALKDRIKNIAKESNRSFEHVWKRLVMERVLARIAESSNLDRFVFKGGNLLSYVIPFERETKDIDFLVSGENKDSLEQILTSTLSISLPDGFRFHLLNLDSLPSAFRAKVQVNFEQIRDSVQIDIGTEDMAIPEVRSLTLLKSGDKPLFEECIKVCTYSLERVFAEKLHSIVSRGESNTRMKDFFDLYVLSVENIVDKSRLTLEVKSTFKERNAEPFDIHSLSMNSDVLETLSSRWRKYLKATDLGVIDFLEVIATITRQIK